MIIRWYRLLAVVFIIIAVFGSFELPRRNLRSTSQVAGMAMDWENGQIKTTFELYVPSADAPFGSKRRAVVGRGVTLEECIKNVSLTHGEFLFVNDASVLIISSEHHTDLLREALSYFSLLKNDHMDLPVFFAFGQKAAKIYEGEGAVISTELAASAEHLKQVQTVKNLMNGVGDRVLIRGEGGYEIIS